MTRGYEGGWLANADGREVTREHDSSLFPSVDGTLVRGPTMTPYEHFHPCPECCEHVMCTMPQCSVRVEDGEAIGGHYICGECTRALDPHSGGTRREIADLRSRIAVLTEQRDQAWSALSHWRDATQCANWELAQKLMTGYVRRAKRGSVSRLLRGRQNPRKGW